jgi:HTH-type transcriptional regulator / antitoxin HigA
LGLVKENHMTAKIHDPQEQPDQERYFDLIQKFPFRPLRSDADLAQAIGVIDSLIVRGDLDVGEQDYLDILTDIVEKYENEEHPMPPVSDAAKLRHLIEARGITQSKLADDVGNPVSTISEILSGKRILSRRHISVFAKYFNVSPMVFPI